MNKKSNLIETQYQLLPCHPSMRLLFSYNLTNIYCYFLGSRQGNQYGGSLAKLKIKLLYDAYFSLGWLSQGYKDSRSGYHRDTQMLLYDADFSLVL